MIVHPNFDPVAISIGSLSIHWYGLMYLCGFISGILLGYHRSLKNKSDWRREDIFDLVFYVALGVMSGGRLGYVLFYNLNYYVLNPIEIVTIWDGGMSFHGGLIGVLISIYFYAKKKQKTFLFVGDFLVPLIPPGLFFGRIGNFINQELWGRISNVPWVVYFHSAPPFPRHPSQIYESLLEGLLLFVVLWCFSSKPRYPGQIGGLFLFGYGLIRFFLEWFREPDSHIGIIMFGWMTLGQLLSIPMLIVGVYLLLRKRISTAYRQ